ncbi:MAG: DUF924 family protein, partial [Kiloniellales bacterium]|nr:DUF924 family protein [Kiloniellales bacterium]
KQWFKKSAEFDKAVNDTLAPYLEPAACGDLDSWLNHPRAALALIILLDQVPRNLFREDARRFNYDEKALKSAHVALELGHDKSIKSQRERSFFYLPFEHSEALEDQIRCCELMADLEEYPDLLKWAEMHRKVIERFGRFPHRNAFLGRESSDEEAAFLKEPGSSF